MNRSIVTFLAITASITLIAGLAAFHIGGEETFESLEALPFLLLVIWSPNIAALWVRWRQDRLRELLEPLGKTGGGYAWAIAMAPLAVAGGLALMYGPGDSLPITTIGLIVAMNLVMGPTGEELGWRGFLLPELRSTYGWAASAGIVGGVWALWHAPLWFLPSPQSAIPFWVFGGTVMAFSYLMTAAYRAGSGALVPMVVFHLNANVGIGLLEVTNTVSASTAYTVALPAYAALAVLAWNRAQ